METRELAAKLWKQCGGGQGFPTAIAFCLLEKEKAFGHELEQAYKKALEAVGEDAPLLCKAERSWLKYQEDACKFDAALAGRDGPGYARMHAAECQLLMTLERLKELCSRFPPENVPVSPRLSGR